MPTSESIGAIIHALADDQPKRPAILAPERPPLTYEGLWRHVRRTIAALRQFGLSPSDRVAITLPNGPEAACAFLTISSYTTSAPVNPAHRKGEVREHLQAVRATAVMLALDDRGPTRQAAEELGLKLLEISPTLTRAAGEFAVNGIEELPTADFTFPSPDGVAMVLPTSGTTARPKIVPLTQARLVASARNIASHLRLSPADRALHVMPLFHSHGLVGGLLSSIVAGASVVCTTGWDDRRFFDWVAEFDPTWYTATPAMHQTLLERPEVYRQKAPGHKFRFVRSTSASLPAPAFARLEAALGAPLIESYGMTEWSQMVSNPLPPAMRKPGSVGLPSGVEVAIVDSSGVSVPAGSSGEVVVRGPGLMTGYENDPEANASAFAGGWFHTGDAGRFDADGYLFIDGRLKEIVNRGGEKVSPLEVEATLLRHPDVGEAVTFAMPHETLGEDLAAAVVPRRAGVDAQALRDFLFQELSDFKVPSTIILVDRIPRSETSKVQRARLHETFASQLKRQFVAPRTPLEQSLAAILSAVLDRETIGVEDNFFSSGGDSLAGIRATTRINREHGIKLPAATLFRYPTIASLAPEVTRRIETLRAESARLEQEVAALSDEEVARLLAAEEAKGGVDPR